MLDELLRIAENSDCDKIKFGAAALDVNGNVLAFGWNHNPCATSGYSCLKECVGGIRQGVESGTRVERCFALHAEQHALLIASRPVHEIAVAGIRPDCSLFDNGGGFYCTVCARIMAAAHVSFVSIWCAGERRRLSIAEAWAQSYGVALK